ncbi:MAG: PilT/PilU family type 4a pilus ATPase [Candidatus Riflebacteria bacterium]|nr:PilT/PilU family type 4a pilus ATPase [Candidatus Riflebacteria bacterium]
MKRLFLHFIKQNSWKKGSEYMKELSELLRSLDENERKQALVILFRNPNKENIAILNNLSENDPHVDVRFLAKRALNLIHSGGKNSPKVDEENKTSENKAPEIKINEQKIKNYLEGTEKEKLSVIQHIVTNGLKQLLPSLVERLTKENDPMVISSLILGIGKLGAASYFQHLLPFFDHPNPRIRASVVEASGMLGATQAYPLILKLLEDSDNRVRGNALMVIKDLGLTNTVKIVKEMADSDLISMKASAAFVLRFFPSESNVGMLKNLLSSTDVSVRNNAVKTLQIFKEKGIKSAEELISSLGSNAQTQAETLDNLESGITASTQPTQGVSSTPISPPNTTSAAKLNGDLPNLPSSKDSLPTLSQPQMSTASNQVLSSKENSETDDGTQLPKNFIGISGRGRLHEKLKPYAQQSPPEPAPGCSLDQILVWARTIQASDIHISPGKPVLYRQFGLLKSTSTPAFSVEQTFALIQNSQIEPRKLDLFNKCGDLETVLAIQGAGRFRVTLMKHLGGINITARVIPWLIRTFEETEMPASCKGLIKWAQGLILVTGPTGSGKTSNLSTFVEMINQTRQEHIITIERPIEIVFEPAKCQISQREVGSHTLSQNSALRGALREDPDILVVSELRDLDSIQLAISAAETGHLVFGTMNTVNAARTISRLTDSFAPEEQSMLQNMLSESLRGIICQQLIPRKDGTGVVPAYEVMIVTTAVSNMIRKEGIHQLASVMTLGKSAGMVTMDQSLKTLVESKIIAGEEAFIRAESKRDFAKYLPVKA